MPITVLFAVLAAALVHAGWNVLIKRSPDKLTMTLAVAVGAGLISALVLPLLPQPAAASWPYLAASVALQSVYYLLIARSYRLTDMSLAYPLMRGLAPLIVALASLPLTGEALASGQWLGVAGICGGILLLALVAGATAHRAGVVSALANAVVIAAYTLIDGLGARLSGAAPAYALYLAVGTAVVTAALVLSGGHRPTLSARTMALGLLGGGATTLSYGVALWAMTRAPVALVAALRETSILFALALSALLLGERVGRGRLVAAALVAAGVVTLKLG